MKASGEGTRTVCLTHTLRLALEIFLQVEK